MPDFVLAYSWLLAYARAGLSSELFGIAWTGISGPVGVAVIVASSAVPLVYLITRSAWPPGPSQRPSAPLAPLAQAVTVLRTITLPLLAPAVATAAVLVFVLTLGTFAVPQVIGAPAGFEVITTRIYADLAYSSDPQSFVDATTLAVLLDWSPWSSYSPVTACSGGRLQLECPAARDLAWSVHSRLTRVLVTGALAAYVLATTGFPLAALIGAAFTRGGLMADALAEKLDDIERIDRLTTIAENRRNASLREIDRRRAVLGETLRRSVQEIEDGEFEVIETTPAKGKNAA